MRTADQIEENRAQKDVSEKSVSPREIDGAKPKRKVHPNSLKALEPTKWVPGVSGNPGGKPKFDVGAVIARAVLEQNQEAAYRALTSALLKGNAYVFKELCERGFGKLKEMHEVKHVHEDVTDKDLKQRVADLERDLGLAAAIDEAGRVGIAAAGNRKTNGKAKVADVLS